MLGSVLTSKQGPDFSPGNQPTPSSQFETQKVRLLDIWLRGMDVPKCNLEKSCLGHKMFILFQDLSWSLKTLIHDINRRHFPQCLEGQIPCYFFIKTRQTINEKEGLETLQTCCMVCWWHAINRWNWMFNVHYQMDHCFYIATLCLTPSPCSIALSPITKDRHGDYSLCETFCL